MNASAIVCHVALAFSSRSKLMKETDRLNHIYKFPTQILRNSQLTSSDKIVAFHLFRFINKYGMAIMPKVKDMVKQLNLTKITIINSKKKLIANNILSVEENTYRILLAGQISYSTTDFHNKGTMNMMGNFIKAPLSALYADGVTSLQKLCAMIFFDYFFFEKDGYYFQKRDREIKLVSLHNLYKDIISYDSLKKCLEACKKAGLIDWHVFKHIGEDGEVHNKMMGGKFMQCEYAVVPITKQRMEMKKKIEEEEELQNIEEKVMDMTTDKTKLTDEEIEKCMDIVNPALARKFKTIVAKWPKQEALKWLASNKSKDNIQRR